MDPSDTIKKVFISHASEDHDLALAVCEALESAGIGCWIAPRDIPGGKHWGAEIVQVIQSSSVLLLLLDGHLQEQALMNQRAGLAPAASTNGDWPNPSPPGWAVVMVWVNQW